MRRRRDANWMWRRRKCRKKGGEQLEEIDAGERGARSWRLWAAEFADGSF